MINRELIEVFSEIAREKNVERSELATILEDLFLYVIEKEYGDSSNCSCIVNLDKGEIEIYAEKTIVEEIDDQKVEITLAEAIEKEPEAAEDLEIGDVFVEVIDPQIFGRRLIVTAKQFFAQRLRDVERNYIYEDYAHRVGEIIIGVVHQVQRDSIFGWDMYVFDPPIEAPSVRRPFCLVDKAVLLGAYPRKRGEMVISHP